MESDSGVVAPAVGESTPSKIEARLHSAFVRLCICLISSLVVLAAANVGAILFQLDRGAGNHSILRVLEGENGPEATRVQKTTLDLNRAQIDCDGQIRESASDNKIISVVAEFVPSLKDRPLIDLSLDAQSCKSIPKLEQDLDEAQAALQRARDRSHR